MTKILSLLAALTTTALFAAAACAQGTGGDLFFSEHVEGSASNKALEIYNPTDAAVNLGEYSVELYSNGNTTATSTETLSGSLAAGAVYVIANGSADPAILAVTDLTSGVANFNGDDVQLLKHNGTLIDAFGQLGVDPGSSWGSGEFESKDHSLRRKDSICAGDSNPDDAFDPATEWDSFPKDNFDGLGSHSANCGGASGTALGIADVSMAEGDSGSTPFAFTITLSAPAPAGGVSFDIATGDGTATVADNDYLASSVTGASIAAGDTSYVFTVQVTGDTTPEPDEDFTVTVSNIIGTDVVTTTASATGTIENDDIATLAIHAIQGTPATQGADGASPWAGQTVDTGGIVTAVVPGAGFYLQTPDAEADGDPLSSEGIYVFAASANVAVGDAITLRANVSEYYGLTELSGVSNLAVVSQGNALPAPVVFDAATPSPNPAALSCGTSNFECFEGMRVTIGEGLVTQGSGWSSKHTYDYLYVTASGRRSLREPGLLYGLTPTAGDNDAAGVWDGNPEVFEMSPNEFPGVNDDTVAITGGSRFAATGVIGYSFGAYAFYPTALTVTEAVALPRAVPTADAAMLRIGSFNVERYCDDVDDTVTVGEGEAIPPGKELYECAGSALPTAAEYAAKTQRLADYIGTVLNLPDVVALQEVENIGVLTQLADRLQADYGIDYAPRLLEGNDVSGIDVGYLVNTARVQTLSVMQLDKYLKWVTPNNHNRAVFDHPPLLLQGIFTAGGASQPFMVLVNHLKARQNVDKVTASGAPTAKALEDQEKRFRQAYALAMLVRDLQSPTSAYTGALRSRLGITATAEGIPLAVVGDFNAYPFTDGYGDLVGMVSGTYDFAANNWDLSDLTAWNLETLGAPLDDSNVVDPALWNAVASLPANERYSYLYTVKLGAIQGYGIGGGSRDVPTDQILDNALLNPAARAIFARMDFGRGNLDAASQDLRDSTGPLGVSDHDGFVLQFTLDRIFQDGFDFVQP